MNYWLVRGRPRDNDNFAFVRQGARVRWHTRQPPADWRRGDRLLFWASSPQKALIAIGSFEGVVTRAPAEGETVYRVSYRSGVASSPVHIDELRGDIALANAIFLKSGPARSVVRLTPSEGKRLYQLLREASPEIGDAWSDVPKVRPRKHILPDLDVAGSEGEPVLREHFVRERDRQLVAAKRQAVMGKEGRLACEVCGFDFEAAYGKLGRGFCEVHHCVPLASVEGSRRTLLEDLAIVCSNCHRMIHRGKAYLTIRELRAEWLRRQRGAKRKG